jgi:NTP pyrophosphatase (non-canonical NTP hydrolase)
MSIKTYATLRAANQARQAEWDPDKRITLSYRGNELAGETGEACNVMKKLDRERLGIRGSRDTLEHLAEELADILICVDLIAIAEGIDIDAALVAKFNATSEQNGLETYLSATSYAETTLHGLAQRDAHWLSQGALPPLPDVKDDLRLTLRSLRLAEGVADNDPAFERAWPLLLAGDLQAALDER